jgi:hypothetical protein
MLGDRSGPSCAHPSSTATKTPRTTTTRTNATRPRGERLGCGGSHGSPGRCRPRRRRPRESGERPRQFAGAGGLGTAVSCRYRGRSGPGAVLPAPAGTDSNPRTRSPPAPSPVLDHSNRPPTAEAAIGDLWINGPVGRVLSSGNAPVPSPPPRRRLRRTPSTYLAPPRCAGSARLKIVQLGEMARVVHRSFDGRSAPTQTRHRLRPARACTKTATKNEQPPATCESIKTVQGRLGHATAAETLDTYAHLWPDSDDRTREAIDSTLGRP